MEQEISPEVLFKASALEKRSQEVENEIAFVDKQISELEEFNNGLEYLSKTKEKEMLSSLGKGVYVKTSLEGKELFVNVGSGVMVKKTPEQAKKVVQDQLKKLKEARIQLSAQMEAVSRNLAELLMQVEKAREQKSKNPK